MHLQSIKDKLRGAYTKAPLNFSTLTGWRYPSIPRLKGNFLLGRLTYLFNDNGILENIVAAGELAAKHSSGMCYFWIGPQLAMLFTRLEDIHEIKVKADPNLSTDLPLLEKFAGPSIFTDKRDIWRQKRHACQQATSSAALKKMEAGMLTVMDNYLKKIAQAAGQPVQLDRLFYNLIVDMVSINLMGCEQGASATQLQQRDINALSEPAKFLAMAMKDVFEFRNVFKWMLPGFLRKLFFRNEETNFTQIKKKIREGYYNEFLNPNKNHILASKNLLKEIWCINHAKSTDSTEFKNEEIYSDGLFLLSAGVATTVATLEFAIKLIEANPAIKAKFISELNQHLPTGELTFEAINQIAYLEMILMETMRLYPPVPLFLPREITKETVINGVPLFKGDLPMVSAYLIHRSPQVWEEPLAFKPERFAEENRDKIPRDAYMPFSIGPRFCAGQMFAMQEMKLILAALYLNYAISIKDNSFEVSLKEGGLAPKMPTFVDFSARMSN